MEEILSNYSSIDIETMQKNMEKIRMKCMEVELLKKNLEEYFGFEITDYIILDIIENEDYNHLCLMINVAIINERMSEENGMILKQGIKKIFGIVNEYDRLNKEKCPILEDILV